VELFDNVIKHNLTGNMKTSQADFLSIPSFKLNYMGVVMT
jgi:hypothetical protein